MSIVVCWFKWTLKQLEREQTDTQTDRQTDTHDDYRNPRACAPRVNKDKKEVGLLSSCVVTHSSHVSSGLLVRMRGIY